MELQRLKGRPSHVCDTVTAVKYACEHEFYRHAVVSEDQFLETALRRRIGLGALEEIKGEAVRQGVLFKDGLATTERQRQEERDDVRYCPGGTRQVPSGGGGAV